MTTNTYPAVLRDGRIEWVGGPPVGLPAGEPVPVRVTLLVPDESAAERGRRMAAILQQLADRGTAFADINDPVAWQRDQRAESPAPGRD
ncbi:MAG: hypothetical protein U0871_03905 [Gemmataceae bacterium]